MNFKIEKVLERDIDLLIINNVINNRLLDLFINKLDIKDYKIISIEHSCFDVDLGESDITVIIEKDNHKIGLLIEDKIDAPAMDLQPERYVSRGEKGITNHLYDEFKTIIVAPKQYLDTNPYVEKYQYKISYEELIEYLSNDLYATTLLNKAIEEKETGYIIIENEKVTNFWKRYYEFVRVNYPQLKIHEIEGPRGTYAAWPEFITDYSQVKIMHKSDRGLMDLTFGKMANYVDIFNKYVKEKLDNVIIVQTGKSLSIRINVPVIDFKDDFDNYIDKMHKCMKAAVELYNILPKINVLMMYNEIKKI